MYEKELIAFTDAGARFIVVGAIALALHHHPRSTMDLDILPDLDPENLSKIIGILHEMDYRPRLPIDPKEMLDPARREEWYQQKHLRVVTFAIGGLPPREIDLMIYPPISYETCKTQSRSVEVSGRCIYIASLGDLLFMKKTAMRPKDLNDIAVLERLIEAEQEESGTAP